MEEAVVNNAVEKKGYLKKVLAALVLVVIAAIGWNVWHYYYNAATVSQKEPWNIAQWWLYDKGLDRAIASDTIGGDTPEGAMEGYIDALEAGDIDLAAKYYIPTKQGGVLKELADSKDGGHLGKYIGVLKSLDQIDYSTSTNSYHIYRLETDFRVFGDTTIVFNPVSNKWKIAEP